MNWENHCRTILVCDTPLVNLNVFYLTDIDRDIDEKVVGKNRDFRRSRRHKVRIGTSKEVDDTGLSLLQRMFVKLH